MQAIVTRTGRVVSAVVLVGAPGGVGPPPPHGAGAGGDLVPFVSDGTSDWTNWDVYVLDLADGTTTRLTTDAAIDNHPALNTADGWLCWSSNRGPSGEFDLWLADLSDVEGTARQLTDDSYPNGPQWAYPDRHPHFHPSGRKVVFTSKNRPLDRPVEIASECSVPKIIVPPRYYEGINVITLDSAGSVTSYTELDLRDAWDRITYPDIWVEGTGTYAGHPSFSPDGTKLVFSGSVDGEGKVWEVYTAGWDDVTTSLVPGSLRRLTEGPDGLTPNPIKMSGGAHFDATGTNVLFSSTRTVAGNSQIFRVPATSIDVPVTSATRITWHPGNDYVPDALADGRIVVTSDLGVPSLCGDPDVAGPTTDLDIVVLETDGSRTPVGDEDWESMLLIGDEVSWFCGLKPNLSSCTYTPRIMNVEALWLEQSAAIEVAGGPTSPIPPDLLAGYGYPGQAVPIYADGWRLMDQLMTERNPLWPQAKQDVQNLATYGGVTGTGFPGLLDALFLQMWLQETAELRMRKYVVASVMYGVLGLGTPFGEHPDLVVAFTAFGARYRGPAAARRCKIKASLELQNTGDVDAPSSAVSIYLSDDAVLEPGRDTLLKTLKSGRLREGRDKTKTVKLKFPAGQDLAGKFLLARIDAQDAVVERSEANNAARSDAVPAEVVTLR